MSRLRWNVCQILCQKIQQHQSSNSILLSRNVLMRSHLSVSCRQYAIYSRNVLNIGIVGVPLCEGQSKNGVEHAPVALRNYGLIDRLQDLGHNVTDYGDVSFEHTECSVADPNAKKAEYIGAASKKIFTAVSEVIQSEKICLTIGGDHSLAIGSILGHCSVKPKMCILFVDAHADINTPETTATGNIHGMAVSFVLSEMQKYIENLPGFDWVKSGVSKNNLAYLALRSVDPPERKFLEELNIKYYSMREIDRLGIYRVINLALEHINPCGNLPLHLSFDIDALDKYVAPSTGTAVPAGLTLREALVIAEEVARTGTLSAMDMVEVNPTISHDEDVKKTILAALDIIAASFYNERAGSILGRNIPLYSKN